MTLVLYGVTDGRLAAQLGDGLSRGRLRHLPHRHLSAVVSDLERSPSTDEHTMRAYASVIERLAKTCTLLPARFGTTAQCEAEIVEMLAARHAGLTAALERVRGAVEFAVHAAPTKTPEPPEHPESPERLEHPERPDAARPGTAYMLRRLTREQQTRELATSIRAAAGDLVREERTGRAGSVAYLVAARSAEDFVQRATALGATVTGPWPPYSFVGGAR